MTEVAMGLHDGCKALGVDFCAMVAYCEEGDNVGDGVQMATRVCEHSAGGSISLPQGGWKAPASWRMMQEEAANRALYT
eukprot:CAMPEP_0173399168 /NCGR_PEP_ID=MMETSP1356-20130122/44185_1 /TAXON_ID=77927 ORGANISM="Hemiselmis virescens, Strain PCC157" /NCGR_SAMPLE_ID=MMETSP1356 /ASSEMBLY_ACC=CAM_ASM_000847 /LENGTH=78 /DNA_ID=CAMNT_0014358837 /DNA_START=66 /DNA_END=302 /DNA_ORIENTATION=-